MKKGMMVLCMCCAMLSFGQKTLDKLLKQQNKETIPYIHVNALKRIQKQVLLLDARETKEYNTSHIKDAICVGYDFFNLDTIQKQFPKKNAQIVVYCSLGIRSEDIAERLKTSGYTNVFNLYGGIFEWKNNHLDVVNLKEKKTDSVHAFSPAWGKWLKNGIKIYD